MNHATLERSDRLQRLMSVLRDGKAHTTRDLVRRAHICAVNSCVAELRAQGKHIECWREGDRWYYRMVRAVV